MEFEWDETKAQSNLARHGVSFEEAKTVFDDPLFVEAYDPDHSEDEHRYVIVGESHMLRLLVVSYTDRDETTRIISARDAMPSERRYYETG